MIVSILFFVLFYYVFKHFVLRYCPTVIISYSEEPSFFFAPSIAYSYFPTRSEVF